MSYSLSRLMSAATATYGGYALAQPRHIGEVMTSNKSEQASYDVVAQVFGVRDLAVSALALLGRSDKTIQAAMRARIMFDVGDGLLLAAKADSDEGRNKILAVTMGWATLNYLALTVDRRRADR
jgi:hypothetical protein